MEEFRVILSYGVSLMQFEYYETLYQKQNSPYFSQKVIFAIELRIWGGCLQCY